MYLRFTARNADSLELKGKLKLELAKSNRQIRLQSSRRKMHLVTLDLLLQVYCIEWDNHEHCCNARKYRRTEKFQKQSRIALAKNESQLLFNI